MHFSKSDGRMRIVMIRLSMWHHDDNSEVEMVLLITIRSEIFDFTQIFLKKRANIFEIPAKICRSSFQSLTKKFIIALF